MIYLGIGLLTLFGYIYFDNKFPKRPKVEAETYEMDIPIVYGDNFIQPPEKGEEYDDLTEYNVYCRISPCKALLIDGAYYDMKVPEEFMIRAFKIGVKTSDNTVNFIELGPNQYHADKCPKTGCLYIDDKIQGMVLTTDLMYEIMARIMVYELEHSMSFGHWDNAEFTRLNKELIDRMKQV